MVNLAKLHLWVLIVGACCIHGSIAQTRSIDPVIQKQIDDFITDCYFPNSGVSKLGLAVVQDDGEILYTTGYGLANQDKGIPNTNQTQFLIGSASKSFTSLLVVKVLHEIFPQMGEAVLDTPIRKLVPSVNFTLIDRFRSEHATFRDLLSHRMCLFRDDWQMMAEPFNTTSEIVYRQRYAKDICGMRTQYMYNNQMYVIAGELIGILANSTYTELMHGLLADIGMLNSSLISKSDDFPNMPFRAQPYYVMNNISYPFNPDLLKRIVVSSAAGGLFVPPNDMVRYLRLHLNKGIIEGKQIIPENVMSWMTKPSMAQSPSPWKSSENDRIMNTFAYGLGLNLGSYDGWQHIQHGGYMAPYSTLISLFPGKNLGVFTSTNEGPLKVSRETVHAFIFDVLRGQENATEQCKLLAMENTIKGYKNMEKEKALQKILEDVKRESVQTRQPNEIVGEYGSGSQGDAEIVEKFNEQTNATGLYIKHGKWAQGWLDNINGSLYQITWDTDIVQDQYADGISQTDGYANITNERLEILLRNPENGDLVPFGTFELGVNLANLPPIPWSPGSCGPIEAE